jgi:hypothetical protein
MDQLNAANGAVTGAVRFWLGGEGFAVLLLSVLFYWQSDLSWWWFFGLLLVPDVFMLPYAVSVKAGTVSYNLAHNYVFPLGLAAYAIAFHQPALLPYLCIWTAHIGMDRALGFGLKYPTSFRSTHLGL